MADTYLTTTYKDRDQVKSLGARWDPAQKKWFVPTGRDLTPFASWLPAQSRSTNLDPRAGSLAAAVPPSTTGVVVGNEVVPLANKGVPLSQLLAGVAQAVAQAYRSGVWTRQPG